MSNRLILKYSNSKSARGLGDVEFPKIALSRRSWEHETRSCFVYIDTNTKTPSRKTKQTRKKVETRNKHEKLENPRSFKYYKGRFIVAALRQTRVGQRVGRSVGRTSAACGRWRHCSSVATYWKSHTRVQIPRAITSGTEGKVQYRDGKNPNFFGPARTVINFFYFRPVWARERFV